MIMRLLVLLFAASLYSADSAAIDPAYLIYPLEQASIKIDSGVRSKQRIDLDIKQHCFAKRCPIKVGLKYASMRGLSGKAEEQSEHIREVFFTKSGHHPTFPLEIALKMYDDKSKVVIEDIKKSGEVRKGYIYGGTTITSIFGQTPYYCLPPGKYIVEFQILDAERDVSELSLSLVVLNDFKFKCGS